MAKSNKHIFAIYYPEIDTLQAHHVDITDGALVKRIAKVLRLSSGDYMTLFGQRQAATCKLVTCEKKRIVCEIDYAWPITPLKPKLIWYLPIAEKSVFEDAVSYLTVLGAYAIYPIITEKSKRSWGTRKDFDRIHRVMVAAAEQSKQLYLPNIYSPCTMHEMPIIADYQYVCNPDGSPLRAYLSDISPGKQATFAGLVGPESGLTDAEVAYLSRIGWQQLRLVPSVLRTQTAVAVGAGAIRSLLTDAHTPVSV